MSKAFTKEDDDAPVAPVARHRVPVPEGVPNYVTAAGARLLRAELEAGPADPVRVQELTEHLASAELVEPEAAAPASVRFGCAVTVADDEDDRVTYRIVGAIEADPRAHAVSWQSPIARALLGGQVGDLILLPRAGEVEIVAIAWA